MENKNFSLILAHICFVSASGINIIYRSGLYSMLQKLGFLSKEGIDMSLVKFQWAYSKMA